MKNMKKIEKTTNTAITWDEHAIADLLIFADNCRAVYMGTTWNENVPGSIITGPGLEGMIECIKKHIIRGNGSIERAEKGIYNVLSFAAKVYYRLFCDCESCNVFPAALRREAAHRYVAAHYSDWEHEALTR